MDTQRGVPHREGVYAPGGFGGDAVSEFKVEGSSEYSPTSEAPHRDEESVISTFDIRMEMVSGAAFKEFDIFTASRIKLSPSSRRVASDSVGEAHRISTEPRQGKVVAIDLITRLANEHLISFVLVEAGGLADEQNVRVLRSIRSDAEVNTRAGGAATHSVPRTSMRIAPRRFMPLPLQTPQTLSPQVFPSMS